MDTQRLLWYVLCMTAIGLSKGLNHERMQSCSCANSEQLYWVHGQLRGVNGCFIDVRNSSSAGECLGVSSWTLVLGDSTVRGLLFSVLKLLRDENMWHPNPTAWLGLDAPVGPSGIDIGWMDAVFIHDRTSWNVFHIKSGGKESHVPKHIFQDYKRPRSSLRITYVMAKSLPHLVHDVMPLFHNAYSTASHVILGGGMWDIYYANKVDDYIYTMAQHEWFETLAIDKTSDLLANKLAYYTLFVKMHAMCRRRANGCVWVGSTARPRPTCNAVANMWDTCARDQTSLRTVARWNTTPPGHFVDHAHCDNLVNIWHAHMLLEACCHRRRCVDDMPYFKAQGYCDTHRGKKTILGRKEWKNRCVLRKL